MVDKLGESEAVALNRLKGLEGRFRRDPSLQVQYTQFLEDYSLLGHMKRVVDPSGDERDCCYLTHHGVFKNPQHPSKIRVVFDASSKSSTVDIIKMYRQILVDPSQTSYQRILWRDDPATEIKTFELNT